MINEHPRSDRRNLVSCWVIKEKLLIERIDKTLSTLEIGPDYLKKLEDADYTDDQKVVELKQALTVYVRINLNTNPIYETLSQRLERIIKYTDKSKMLQDMESIVKEINELDRKIAEKGITKEEYALMATAQKYLPSEDEKELIGFVRNLLSGIGTGLFDGWQRKRSTVNEVERIFFDSCFKTFSKTLEPSSIVQLSEELMKFIEKYHP